VRTLAQGASVRTDPNLDAALVFVNPTARSPVEINFADSKDDSAYAFVWDKASAVPEIRPAEIARTDVSVSGPGLRLAGKFRQGHSGAPVFDQHGRAVAIVTSGDDTDQYTLALPLAVCRTLLSSAPRFAELRRFRTRLDDRLPSSLRDGGEAIRSAATTQARRTVREQAAGFVEGFFFERGSRIDADKAMEFVDAVIIVKTEQSEVRRDGFVELSTFARGVLEIPSLETIANRLEGSAQAQELRRARATEQALLQEIDRLKSKLAGIERAGTGTAALQSEINEALTGKSNDLRSNDLLRRALVAKSLGRDEQAKGLLDNLINDFPKLEAARVERGSIEDNAYLVASRSTQSSEPYRSLARLQFERGDDNEARKTLQLMRQLFPNFGVVELSIASSGLTDAGIMVADYLTLDMEDGYVPPWSLKKYGHILARKANVLVFPTTFDFDKYAVFKLVFRRYGYTNCSVEITRAESKPGEIIKKTCHIEPDKTPATGTNQITGKVALSNDSSSRGIRAVIYNRGDLAGFVAGVLTDEKGLFQLKKLPDGKDFELTLSKDGYVNRRISFALRNGEILCVRDEAGNLFPKGGAKCDPSTYNFRLYPIRQVTLKWKLQETPGVTHFRETVSEGNVVLSSELQYDWRRGGWWCCDASYRFGTKQVRVENADILLFTDLSGRIFLAQPEHQAIARMSVDYDELIDLPAVDNFSQTQEVTVGATYLVRTYPTVKGQEVHYTKLKVISIK